MTVAACASSDAVVTEPPRQQPPVQALTVMRLALSVDTLRAGETAIASVSAFDQNGAPMTIGDPAWTTSASAIASVSSSGVVTANGTGPVTITVRMFTVQAQLTLSVLPPRPGPLPVHSVAVLPVSGSLESGASMLLSATTRDYAGNTLADREIVWSSSDDAVATVTANGTVTALAAGTAIIEAVSESRRGAFALTVTPAIDSSIVIGIPYPYPQSVVGDTITAVAVVQSSSEIVSVTASVGGQPTVMRYGPIGNAGVLGNGQQAMGWSAQLNLTTLPFGPYALVITAIDVAGHRRLRALPIVRNPKATGGSKNPVGSK